MLIHPDFMLETAQARELYYSYAEPLPVIDYHGHLPVKDIAEDRHFENLTRVWLAGDHYKWRVLRAAGVDEDFITGAASDREKFDKWAETVPKTLRNPLYHWAHLELARTFGISDRLLNPDTAPLIWEECNALLASPGYTARGLLRLMNVEVLCTTDDPLDDLRYHSVAASAADFPVRIFPAFRPDRALAVEDAEAFSKYVDLLALASDVEIKTFVDFLAALRARHDYFHAMGCRLSDHGLETVPAESYTDVEVRKTFARLRSGKPVGPEAALQFRSAMLYEFAVMDWEKGWTQQFHLGALRNVNSRMMRTLGPDSGFDAIGEFEIVRPLARFLDRLDAEERLARTVLYNLNPRDSEALAALVGCFQDGRVPGKVQYGPAWWFLDQADGMARQLEALSNLGLLSQFVGMTTDSRSFLSFPRHEYFRRLLCDTLGADMARGRLPGDLELVGAVVRDICYFNARRYFRFPEGVEE
jgi:glucuronate isomerase